MDILWRIHPEAAGIQRLFALESRRDVSRIMRRMTCSGMSQLCLGECVAEVRVLGRHGIRQEGAYEREVFNPAVDSTGMSAMCSDLNRMHDEFREMSPPSRT